MFENNFIEANLIVEFRRNFPLWLHVGNRSNARSFSIFRGPLRSVYRVAWLWHRHHARGVIHRS